MTYFSLSVKKCVACLPCPPLVVCSKNISWTDLLNKLLLLDFGIIDLHVHFIRIWLMLYGITM